MCFIFYPAWRFPTWFRWRKSGRRAESESGGDGLLANPRSRPTPLSAFRTPASESVGWLLLLFAIEKQRKKKKFSHVLLGPKVPKASARRSPRECASRGAARGAQDQALAPPRDGRAACRTLFFPRRTRVRNYCAAGGGNIIIYMACAPALFFPAWRVPTWFRWRKSGRRAESESGGDGLLANPRSRPTPLSGVRTSTSESVGWLLLLFATEKQGKKFFGTFLKRGKDFGGFCCFSPLKSREKSFSELNVREIFGKSHPAAGCSQYVPT